MQASNNGKMPLFERMLTLDPLDFAQPLAMKANALYMALTPTSITQAATNAGENDTTRVVYDMLRDWKYTEHWAERAILSFRRSESEQQMSAVEWLTTLMRTCKSAGDLHHASALLGALRHPAIIRLPEVHDAFTAQMGKSQATVDIITKDKAYNDCLQRRYDKSVSTSPILRLLMDYLRTAVRRNSIHEDGKNSKLIRMFSSFHGASDDHPNKRIDQFLSFQKFPFESALQKKALRRRSAENPLAVAIAQFLKESYELGEQTYEQPNLIVSLSNRLLPWPEAFAGDPPTRQLGIQYLSSMKLSKPAGRRGSLSSGSRSGADRSASFIIESPLHAMCQCLWGDDNGAKRSGLIPMLDDVVMQASQSPSHFPTGEWEATFVESLSVLTANDDRPFRLLIIVESTLLNWHLESRVGGVGDRLRSTFNELAAKFGNVDDVTDVQRLILFSLCSRVSHHVADWRNDPDRPQWQNVKELMQFVIGFVFVEDGPLVFASVDALYDQGRCLDEGLLTVCDSILAKALKVDADPSVDARSQLRKNCTTLRASQAVFKQAVETLEKIKTIQPDDRQTELFAAVKGVRRVLVESRKSVDNSTSVATRLKNLLPFKSATSPKGDARSKRGGTVPLTASGMIGRLARQALAESIERHRDKRDSRALIRRISQRREIRRKSLSEIEPPAYSPGPPINEHQKEPASSRNSPHPSQHMSHRHSRRRSSFPSRIMIEVPAACSSVSDDDVDESEFDDDTSSKAVDDLGKMILE